MLVKSNHKEYCKDCLKNDVCMHRENILEAYEVLSGHVRGTSAIITVNVQFACNKRLLPVLVYQSATPPEPKIPLTEQPFLPMPSWHSNTDVPALPDEWLKEDNDDGFEPLTEEQMPF